MRFKDKVAIVTGGSKGIGAAITRRLWAEGARVANVNRSAEEGEAMQAEYGADSCRFVKADLTQSDACRAAVEEEGGKGRRFFLDRAAGHSQEQNAAG